MLAINLIMLTHYSFGQTKVASSPRVPATSKDTLVPVLTADSLSSGNYKDILTSFYQLAVDNLTGPNKEFRFTTNPYAILLKNNPELAIDTSYWKYRHWRKLNVSLDAKMDSSNHFNGIDLGITYALVDHRDIATNTAFTKAYLKGKNSDVQWDSVHILAAGAIANLTVTDTAQEFMLNRQLDSLGTMPAFPYKNIDSMLQVNILIEALHFGIVNLLTAKNRLQTATNAYAALRKEDSATFKKIDSILRKDDIPTIPAAHLKDTLHLALEAAYYDPADSTKKFSDLDLRLRTLIHTIAQNRGFTAVTDTLKKDSSFSIYKIKTTAFYKLKDSFQTRGLWTIGISDTSYSDGNLAKNLQFNTEWATKIHFDGGGWPWKWFSKKDTTGKNSSPGNVDLEWDFKANVNFMADTTQPGNNLRRQSWYMEPGINLVIRNKSKQSFLEFKTSGGITDVFNGRYKNEQALDVALIGTLRVHIINDIWLPLQIKYDPKTGNVFGFLNVTYNFTGLGSLTKTKKSS